MDQPQMTDNKEYDVTFANYEWEHIKATSSSSLPTCRNCHTATQFNQYMIVFGGKEGEGRKKFCNDIHVLDLKKFVYVLFQASWLSNIKMIGQIPDARMGHSATNYLNKVIYYGGWNGYTVLDDIIIMNPIETKKVLSIEWTVLKTENQSPKRQFHTANIIDDQMYIFGGGDGKMWLSDLFKFDFTTRNWDWIETTGLKPAGRLQHSSAIYDKKIYVFGGEPDRSHQLNDLYQLDLTNNCWTQLVTLGTRPSPRVSASAVIIDTKVYFFGGYDGNQWRNDVFIYNIPEKQWEFILAENPPKPRCRHSAISYKGQIVIFGGNDIDKSYNDVHLLKQQVQLTVADSTLKSDLSNILYSQHLSDVTFIIDGQAIYCHRVILACRCEFFKALFNTDKSVQIAINDVEVNVFKAMLEFIYTDFVRIDLTIAYQLLALADKYMLVRLKNLCEDFLIKSISLKNVIDVVNLADRYSAQQLKMSAMRFLLDNKAKICQSPDLQTLSKDILTELIRITK